MSTTQDKKHHQRQRSSVSVKKRINSIQKGFEDGQEVPDNALSSSTITKVESRENSLSPNNVENIKIEDSIPETAIQQDYFSLGILNVGNGNNNNAKTNSQIDKLDENTTTRSEIDLFNDEDSSARETSSVKENIPIETQSQSQSQIKEINENKAPLKEINESNNQIVTPKMNSSKGLFEINTPASTKRTRGKPLNLLLKDGQEMNRTPSTSPQSSKTPMSARKANRMSLQYVGSNDNKSITSFYGTGQPMTPPVLYSSSKTSSISGSTSLDSSSRNSQDGETILTQNKRILEKIAEKERSILELKEFLLREEKELKDLRREWQKYATRDLLASGSNSNNSNNNNNITNQNRSEEENSTTADAIRGFSVKLQNGIGNQLNAFLDQLASVDSNSNTTIGGGHKKRESEINNLKPVVEESEEIAPPTPEKDIITHQRSISTIIPSSKSSEIKRTSSMFGSSFAESSWSILRKQLNQARENASEFLSMAEARIGQAMILDENKEFQQQQDQQLKSPINNSSSFSNENDREKAALAELNWLNNLAGIKTVGNVDRVITKIESPQKQKQSSTTTISKLDSKNLLKLDNEENLTNRRTISPASTSSHSTTKASPIIQNNNGKRNSNSGNGFFESLTAAVFNESNNQQKDLLNSPSHSKTRLAVQALMQQQQQQQQTSSSSSSSSTTLNGLGLQTNDQSNEQQQQQQQQQRRKSSTSSNNKNSSSTTTTTAPSAITEASSSSIWSW